MARKNRKSTLNSFQTQSRKRSSVFCFVCSRQILPQICTVHDSHGVVLCVTFQKDLWTNMDVMDKRDFARSYFMTDFRKIFCIFTGCTQHQLHVNHLLMVRHWVKIQMALLFNGGAVFSWKLCSHWFKGSHQHQIVTMMTSCHEESIRITGPLWEESSGHRYIPLTKDLWCIDCCGPKQVAERTSKLSVIWDAMTPKWRNCHE